MSFLEINTAKNTVAASAAGMTNFQAFSICLKSTMTARTIVPRNARIPLRFPEASRQSRDAPIITTYIIRYTHFLVFTSRAISTGSISAKYDAT